MNNMNINIDPEFTKQAPEIRNCRMEATKNSGETIVAHERLTLDDITKGMDDKDLKAKFMGLVQDSLTYTQSEAVLDLMYRLEELGDSASILDQLHI